MRGLLHRLASDDPQQPPDVARSVVENVRAILNTQQGDGYTCPDMGVDFVDLLSRWPSSETDVLRAISVTIERFEPRLSNVRVRSVRSSDSATSVAIEITADFRGRDRLRLLTELSQNGRVDVR